MRVKILAFAFFAFFISSISVARTVTKINTRHYVSALKLVTNVMLNDVASPVAASRYYAYISIASYQTLSCYDQIRFPALEGSLNYFPSIKIDSNLIINTDKNLAIILSIFKTGEKLLPSGFMLKKQIDSLSTVYSKDEKSRIIFTHTTKLVDEIVKQIIVYAKKDGFTKLNNLSRYTPKQGDAFWKPTPPVFMAPVEPHWNTIRPFLIDSAQEYKTIKPVAYDTSVTSPFYKLMLEVYEMGKNATEEQKNIANFWDCNPFAVQQIGHVEFGLKKISPGGHWMGITGIACIKTKYSIEKTVIAHFLVATTLADAFIACWDEKYRSNRVRPETVIQKLIDPRWHPLLQTPPFPEYISGHSVASNAAAVILTSIFGDKLTYDDDTEVEFGLPVRRFNSFIEAATEAAISRLYGGIHFMDAIEAGKWQGIQIGNHALVKMEKYLEIIH